MPIIPTVEPFVPHDLPPLGGRADGGLFNAVGAEGAAGRQVGADISGVGMEMENFAQRAQETINHYQEQNIRNEQAKRMADFQASLADPNNPANSADPKDAQAGFMARLADMHAGVDDWMQKQNLPPAVAQSMAPEVAAWKNSTMAATRNQLLQMDISTARGIYEKAYAMAEKVGNLGQMKDLNADAVRHELIKPELQAKLDYEAPKQVAQNAAAQFIDEHPTLAPDVLRDEGNYPDLEQRQRQTLLHEANSQAAAARNQKAIELGGRKDAGEIIPDDEINELVKENYFSPAQIKQLRAPPKGFDADDYAKTYTEVTKGYDPVADAANGNTRRAELMAHIQFTPGLGPVRDKLVNLLDARTDKASPVNSEVATQAHANVNEFFRGLDVKHMVETPAYTDADTGANHPAGFVSKTDPDKLAAAMQQQAKAHSEVNRYLTEKDEKGNLLHPDPHVDDLLNVALPFFQNFGRLPTGSAQPAQPGPRGGGSAPVADKAARDALTAGTIYQGADGKWYRRK